MKRFLPHTQRGRAALAALAVALTVSALFLGLAVWSDAAHLKDAAAVVQALTTAAAIGIGGALAWFKLQIFRDFTPHLTISHEVGHRVISPSYALIDVTVVLHNGSKVHVELRDAIFRLQKVAPLSDEDVVELYDEVYANGEPARARWPKLNEVERSWGEGELMVEPGESHRESCDFIVSTDVAAARVYTFFHNPSFQEGGGMARGWGATTVYDARDYGIVKRSVWRSLARRIKWR